MRSASSRVVLFVSLLAVAAEMIDGLISKQGTRAHDEPTALEPTPDCADTVPEAEIVLGLVRTFLGVAGPCRCPQCCCCNGI